MRNKYALALRAAVSSVLLLAGGWQLGSSAWLLAKAELAQYLIRAAWETQLQQGLATRPWPWADTRPVAKLQLPGQEPLFVLEGGSGQALAFGPGLLPASARPGDVAAERTTVIAAHRDTHFGRLREVKTDALIGLQDGRGRWHHYRVLDVRVVNSEREQLPIFAEPGLMLVTCYPFDAIAAGGPLRYVVYAEYLPVGDSISL